MNIHEMGLLRRLWGTVKGLAAVMFFAAVFSMTVYAYTQTEGTVIPATAKIRAEANTTSAVVGSTAAGKSITITDEVTGSDGSTWYQVIVDASTKGYIRSDLVKKPGGASQPQPPAQSETLGAAPAASSAVTDMERQSGKVTPKSARVRKSASPEGDLVASVSRGTVVTVSGKAKGTDGKEWFKVSFTYNGSTIAGFIRADLITFGELPEEEPAVTEITGTKDENADTPKEGQSESAEQPPTETEPGTEAVSGNEAVPEEPQAGGDVPEGEKGLKVVVWSPEETPKLPDGFQEVSTPVDGEMIRAWQNGEFFIVYGESQDGKEGFYMYDSKENTYQRYYMENVEAAGKKGGAMDSGTLEILVIVLAVIIVVLLIVVTLITLQLNRYKSELGWDEDDYREEEEEAEVIGELEEDLEEEPEEIQPVRRPRKKKTEPPASRPVQSGERTPVKRNPRNFLEAEEELDRIKPVNDDFDPDDEDTFVFINLDGDKID